MFIGCTLRKRILQAIRRTALREQRRRYVVAQRPLSPGGDPVASRRTESYLSAYFEKRETSMFWDTAQEFRTERRVKLGCS